MTQTLTPQTSTGFNLMDALADVLVDAQDIPETGGQPSVISGQPTARFGALIQIKHEIRFGDPRGAWVLGATRGDTFTTPADAVRVLDRMVAEGREIVAVTAVRGMLGGTTRR